MNMNHASLRFIATVFLVLACATAQLPQEQQPKGQPKQQQSKEPAKATPESTPATPPGPGGTSLPNANPFPSTYRPFPGRPTLIRNATIMTAAGPAIQNGSVLLRDGKIAAVCGSITTPADALAIECTGKNDTPRLLDVQSHLCVYPAPG